VHRYLVAFPSFVRLFLHGFNQISDSRPEPRSVALFLSSRSPVQAARRSSRLDSRDLRRDLDFVESSVLISSLLSTSVWTLSVYSQTGNVLLSYNLSPNEIFGSTARDQTQGRSTQDVVEVGLQGRRRKKSAKEQVSTTREDNETSETRGERRDGLEANSRSSDFSSYWCRETK